MTRTERRTGESAGVGPDFDALRERAARLSDCGSARAVREELARVLVDGVDADAVGVYRREGDRFRATSRSATTEGVTVPPLLSGEGSPVADVVAAGGTRRGSVAADAYGDATEYCVTPLNDDGAVLLLTVDPDGVGDGTLAALSMVVGHAEAVLNDVEGGTLRRAATADGRPDVSEEELLEALSHAFPDGAFLFDESGTYLDVLVGIRGIQFDAGQELVGRDVHDVHDEATADRIVAGIRAATDAGEVQRVEYATAGPGGETHYEGRIAPLPDAGRRATAAVLVARDVTDRHQRERDLRRQNERLEEFASIVSHDLRNPLATASGFLDLLSEDVDDERIDRIEAAHDRMATLIDDLLALARDGRTVTDAAPVDLRETAERAWATVSPDGTLEVEGTVTLEADPTRFEQVLENLVGNAADHSSPSPTVRVGPLPADAGFYVADDGPGIPPDERDAVFETGYTTGTDGTGLGLAIVERIADAHGWSVDLRESTDGGVRFEFRGVDLVGGASSE